MGTRLIQHLKNKEIDKTKWDECITNATYPSIYALSWYLDSVSPNWEALVVGDYDLVMPLLTAQKWGYSYLRQAIFCQQTGLYSNKNTLISEYKDRFFEYLEKRYRLIDICLHEAYVESVALLPNYILSLSKPYEILQIQYSTNTKRNLKKAYTENLTIDNVELETLIQLIKKDKTKAGAFSDKDLNRLKNIYSNTKKRKHSKILGIYNANQECIAGALFIIHLNKIIFLFSANSIESKEKRALFLLIDSVIKEYSNQDIILDFEGSANENIARFYTGFGSKLHPYYHLKVNNLPPLIKLFKR